MGKVRVCVRVRITVRTRVGIAPPVTAGRTELVDGHFDEDEVPKAQLEWILGGERQMCWTIWHPPSLRMLPRLGHNAKKHTEPT